MDFRGLRDVDEREPPVDQWQVERMNRTIEDATVKRYHYDSNDQFRAHLADFIAACNFVRRRKILSGLTPYEYICRVWISEPDRSTVNPMQLGLNTQKSMRNQTMIKQVAMADLTPAIITAYETLDLQKYAWQPSGADKAIALLGYSTTWSIA